jgi:hypothetical protein
MKSVDEFEGTEEKRAGSVERTIQIGFAVMFAMLGIVGIISYFTGLNKGQHEGDHTSQFASLILVLSGSGLKTIFSSRALARCIAAAGLLAAKWFAIL